MHEKLKKHSEVHGITDPASVPTFSFPLRPGLHNYYELMVAQGEGRTPMTSSDAETDSIPIIIIIITSKMAKTIRKSIGKEIK